MKTIQEIQKLTANGLMSSLDLLEEIVKRRTAAAIADDDVYSDIIAAEITSIQGLRMSVK
jgi:hypothetical protein